MTKSFKDALSRTSRPIPGIKDTRAAVTSNPFNLKVNKPKFEVLNRNVVGSRGNRVNSRSRAVAVRSATLLPQLQEKNRAHISSFIDRRFGAKDKEVSREEVMQERFAREQQRLATKKVGRKNKFDLNSIKDEVEDEGDDAIDLSMTHGGKNIAQMDDDELETYDGDEDDQGDENEAYNAKGRTGQLDRDLVSAGHFGGPARHDEKKSKQDVMKELIAKSKFYKMERQKIKEENEALCEDVNEAFLSIRGNLNVLNEEDRRKIRESPSNVLSPAAEEDEYEATLKELTFDPRSKPSDRTLTPEEREEKDKKRSEEQTKALLERMSAKTDEVASKEDDENQQVDPELKRIGERQFKAMRDFCHTGSVDSYKKLVEYARKQPRTMIQLSKSIRSDLAKLAESFTKRSNENGRGGVMPALGPIRLLLLVSRIFSCSDYHHVVATPAQLLLSYYLGVGRMTKIDHVKRALGLVYCALQFQSIGKRCVPEALQVLFTLLKCFKSAGSMTCHYFCRPLGKNLVSELKNFKNFEPVDCASLFDSESKISAGQLYGLTVKLSEELFTNLEAGNYPALKEASKPFAQLLPKNKCFNHCANESIAKSLLLQLHKPLSLPLLTPDFATDYSLEGRKRSGQDVDDQSAARMKRAHKREYKGAVRELKRDAAFLAEHKTKEIRKKDGEYKNRMNKIIGSIGNDKARWEIQPSRMKPLTTGLIVCSVAILFVLWNRRFIFRSKKAPDTFMKTKLAAKTTENDIDETAVLLSGLLSLNRAAHVLSRSTALLDKLLKMEKKVACESLLRDYELSSVMVLIKHEEGGDEEGFKKISEVKKEKGSERDKESEMNERDKESEMNERVKGSEMKDLSLSKSESDSQDHHSTTDPLRIVLYCKNLFRPPRIGRVVRLVESEKEHPADQYIIELIK